MSYTKLKDLDLFSNITDITGDLILLDNPDLMNLNGLSKLRSIRELRFGYNDYGYQNTNITHLDSLSSLINGKITIQGYVPNYGYLSITSVYGIRNLKTGIVNFQGTDTLFEKYMQVKAPANSSLCSNIKLNNIILEGDAAYYNICESLPEETEILKTFDYFKNYCNVLIPESNLNNFSSKTNSYTCKTDLQTVNYYEAEGALKNWSTNGIRLTGDKTTGVFKKVETVTGSVSVYGRSNITDLTEFGSIKTIGGTYRAYSMPNLTSLNGLQNFTGNLKLNAYYNPLLNDVSALSNVVQGDIYLDGRDFGVKNASNSPFCQAIFTEQVKINPGMNNWYGNICELDPVQKDAYDATLWFRDNCNSKAYYSYPNVAAIEGKSSHACTFGQTMNFAPVVTTLKDATFQSIKSASDFGTSLDNLTTVNNLSLLSASGLGYQNVGFLKNLTTVNGGINLSSNNNLLTDISSLSKLNKVTGTFSLSSNNLNNLTGLDNINNVGNLQALRKDYTTKLPNTSTFCNSLSTIVINRGFATEDNLCQPVLGKEGLFELASKIYDGVYDPVYVSDLNHSLGLKSVIISNSYSKINTIEGNPIQIGDYFDLNNTNGLNLLTYVKELNFNNSNATKIPNLFNNVTTMDNINIQNESLLNSLVSFNNLLTVNNNINIKNINMDNFELSNIKQVGIINFESSLTSNLSLPKLENINTLNVKLNNNLTSINLPLIQSINSLNIDSGVLNNLTLNNNVSLNSISVKNTKLTNLDFVYKINNSINIVADFSNNLDLTNINGLNDRAYSSLELTGLSDNIDLYPLSNTIVSGLFKIDDKEYVKKMAFDSSLCKGQLNYNAKYCFSKPKATSNLSNLTSNLVQKEIDEVKVNILKVNTTNGSFSFDVALEEDYINRPNLTYSISDNSNVFNASVEKLNNGTIRISGLVNNNLNNSIKIMVSELDQNKMGYTGKSLLTSFYLTDKDDIGVYAINVEGDETGYVYNGEKLEFFKPGEYTVTSYKNMNSRVKAWGAGGGNAGGYGGYSEAKLNIIPGQRYKIIVGGAGVAITGYSPGGFGGGGHAGFSGQATGSGGGLSGIFMENYAHEGSLIIAGGGGGGSDSNSPGGNGGGLVGLNGAANGYGSGGRGGTQTSGGISVSAAYGKGEDGSALQGGNANYVYGGGGGGGGYYGGSSGTKNNTRGGAGGGGSGFILDQIKFADANYKILSWSTGSIYYGLENDAPNSEVGFRGKNGAVVFISE
jgi:hypothetical protein